MLGQLFLLACIAALLSIAGIFFVLFGPLPVKRRVTLFPRISGPVAVGSMPSIAAPRVAPPSLVAQLAPAPEQYFAPPEPIAASAVEVPPIRKLQAPKVEPLPRKRSARGTSAPSPFAPVVRSGYRQMREEDVATNPVELFDAEEGDEMTMVDDRRFH